MRLVTRITVPLYRLFGGGFAAKMHPSSSPAVFLLTTKGRTSGRARTVPLSYIEDDRGIIVVGSNGGLPEDPQWTGNLRANPEATVQIGRKKIPVLARFTEGEEWAGLRERITVDWPNSYGAVLEAAKREVPIVRLERREARPDSD
jgi:deazaflavin-dependent oxidoreductase (nitroreductase family)